MVILVEVRKKKVVKTKAVKTKAANSREEIKTKVANSREVINSKAEQENRNQRKNVSVSVPSVVSVNAAEQNAVPARAKNAYLIEKHLPGLNEKLLMAL